ncbi:hypothetical protein SF83666_a41810 (plasmid) [Sinorhizobium fredii CCBAU 83666]|nr:hypothetical protein SF83666_a41810 [Sinorhizobium fredii CCBAU 83666]
MDAELLPLFTFGACRTSAPKDGCRHPRTYYGEPSRVGTFTAAEVNQVLAAD